MRHYALLLLIGWAVNARAHDDPLNPDHRHDLPQQERAARERVPDSLRGRDLLAGFDFDPQRKVFTVRFNTHFRDEKSGKTFLLFPHGVKLFVSLYYNDYRVASRTWYVDYSSSSSGHAIVLSTQGKRIPTGLYVVEVLFTAFHQESQLILSKLRGMKLPDNTPYPDGMVFLAERRLGEGNEKEERRVECLFLLKQMDQLLELVKELMQEYEAHGVTDAAGTGSLTKAGYGGKPPKTAEPPPEIKPGSKVFVPETWLAFTRNWQRKLYQVRRDLQQFRDTTFCTQYGQVTDQYLPNEIFPQMELLARRTTNALFRAYRIPLPPAYAFEKELAQFVVDDLHGAVKVTMRRAYEQLDLAKLDGVDAVEKERKQIGELVAKNIHALRLKLEEQAKKERGKQTFDSSAWAFFLRAWCRKLWNTVEEIERLQASSKVVLPRALRDTQFLAWDLLVLGLRITVDLHDQFKATVPRPAEVLPVAPQYDIPTKEKPDEFEKVRKTTTEKARKTYDDRLVGILDRVGLKELKDQLYPPDKGNQKPGSGAEEKR